MSKNIKVYYIYSTFAELLILGPIIILYLFAKGLSFTEITLLQSIAALSVVCFEVPTGAVADRIGRKTSIILGAILWSISLSIYILGESFWVFALAEVVFSLGASFKSGSDTALIYDSLKNMGIENKFQAVEGRVRALSLWAQAVGSVIAGYVYTINKDYPWIVSIGFMVVTILIALNFKEPEIEKKADQCDKKYFRQIVDSGSYVLNHEKIKAIIFFSMVFFVFYRGGFFYFQPYMKEVGIPITTFGWIFFAFNMVAALTSSYSHKIMAWTKPRTLTFMALLIIVSFTLLGFVRSWVGVGAILFQQMARGLYRPVTRKYLNKHIPSDKRATILSFQSLATSIAAAVTLPFIGMLKDYTDIFASHLIMAGIMSFLTFIAIRYMNTRLGIQHREKNQHIIPS